MSFGRPDATPTPMISLTRLAQIILIIIAVALVCVPLLLRFWLPWWLDKPQRDAERQLRETMTAGLESAAREGGVNAHTALRAARASTASLLRFADGADGIRIDVEQFGYGFLGSRGVTDFCYRFTVERRSSRRPPRVDATRLDRCAEPPRRPRPQAVQRIREAAEKTRGALFAATADGPLTRERARPVVTGDLSALWSFHRMAGETNVVADYILLTEAGEVEAAECAHFYIAQGPATHKVTLHRLRQCPPP